MAEACWSDTHCHLDFPAFDADRADIIAQCRALDCRAIVVPGVSLAGSRRAVSVSRNEPLLHAAAGLHPCFMDEHDPLQLPDLARLLPDCVAVGETGLDFALPARRTEASRQAQTDLLELQFALARERDLPLLLHVRRADAAMLEVMDRHPGCRGIVHAFTGSLEMAQAYVRRGFLLGIGAAWCSPRATRLRRLWPQLELPWLVLETDAPDMTPVFRQLPGQPVRNQPDWLPEVAARLARLRDMPVATLLAQAHGNASRMLNLPA